MKAGIIITGSGSTLALSSSDSFESSAFVESGRKKPPWGFNLGQCGIFLEHPRETQS